MPDSLPHNDPPAGLHDDPELSALLARWTATSSSPCRPSIQSALRDYLQRDSASVDQVVSVAGQLWLQRRGGTNPLPVRTRTEASGGDAVYVTAGNMARVRCPDGSEMLLRGQSILQIGSPGEMSDRARYHLQAGEAFIRVIPREKDDAAFTVSTPAGAVEVLGTEFLLSAHDSERMRVLVRRGNVSVHPRGSESPQQLGQNEELLLAPGQEPEVRRIPPRRVRNETRWADRPGRHSARMILWSAVALLLAMVGGFLLWFKEPARFDEKGLARMVPAVTAPNAFDGRRFFTVGQSVEYKITSYVWHNENWLKTSNEAWLIERLPASNNREKLRATLTKFECPPIKGERYLQDFASLTGWSFDYEVDGEGNIRIAELALPPELKGAGAALVDSALSYSPAGLLPKSAIQPGERWSRQHDLALDGSPHLFLRSRSDLRFDGWVEQNGRVMGKIVEEFEGEAGGLTVRKAEGEGATHASLIKRDYSGEVLWFFDARKSHVLGGVIAIDLIQEFAVTQSDTYEGAVAENLPNRQMGPRTLVRRVFTATTH